MITRPIHLVRSRAPRLTGAADVHVFHGETFKG
jgi:hypothetical protein